MFSTRSVLVTGGTGSIGSAIVHELIKRSVRQVLVFSRDEFKQHELRQELKHFPVKFIIGDVRSYEALHNALDGVDIVFHTAAMKHVSICEDNPFEAVQTNILGTQNLIRAANSKMVEKVLAISTDKAVNPTSVLGCSKLLMERMLKASNSHVKFSSIRFGNIIGSRGSVIPLWKKQIEAGGPMTVTHEDAYRYFIDVEKAVAGAFKAVEYMQGGETFIVDAELENVLTMAKKVRDGADNPIMITGLHVGEKISEELMTSEEQLVCKTIDKDLMVF